jgi:hypothetical protein
MKLREALNNPEKLSNSEVEKLFKLGLLKADRTHTALKVKLLSGDKDALEEVAEIIFPRPSDRGPDWVNPPVWTKRQRVFGPDQSSGDMAAFSIGF